MIELNLLIVALEGVCTPESCPKMMATDMWQYRLPTKNNKPQDCCAIDYMIVTLDQATVDVLHDIK